MIVVNIFAVLIINRIDLTRNRRGSQQRMDKERGKDGQNLFKISIEDIEIINGIFLRGVCVAASSMSIQKR